MSLGSEARFNETGDVRWLDPDYYRRMAGPYAAAQFRKRDREARAAAETKLRRADPMYVYLRRMMTNARKNAARRDRDCSLTDNQLWSLLREADGHCQVTGVPFDLAVHANGRAPFAPSVDRINGSKGYVRGNVRLVVQIANLAMNVWDAETLRHFIALAK